MSRLKNLGSSKQRGAGDSQQGTPWGSPSHPSLFYANRLILFPRLSYFVLYCIVLYFVRGRLQPAALPEPQPVNVNGIETNERRGGVEKKGY